MTPSFLIQLYEEKKLNDRLWYLNARAKAGFFLRTFGEMALAKATIALEECSEHVYWYWRTVVGILQDLDSPGGEEQR